MFVAGDKPFACEKLGFDEVAELQDKSRRCAEDMREIIQKSLAANLSSLITSCSQNKNELAFQNRHPEIVSEIFLSIFADVQGAPDVSEQ